MPSKDWVQILESCVAQTQSTPFYLISNSLLKLTQESERLNFWQNMTKFHVLPELLFSNNLVWFNDRTEYIHGINGWLRQLWEMGKPNQWAIKKFIIFAFMATSQ